MLQDLLSLRIFHLDGNNSHHFSDNTCGLIARKCPGLQLLNLHNHNQLSVKGIRKIFEGCSHLRSFYTSTGKLRSSDTLNLLDTAPQLLVLLWTTELTFPPKNWTRSSRRRGVEQFLVLSREIEHTGLATYHPKRSWSMSANKMCSAASGADALIRRLQTSGPACCIDFQSYS